MYDDRCGGYDRRHNNKRRRGRTAEEPRGCDFTIVPKWKLLRPVPHPRRGGSPQELP